VSNIYTNKNAGNPNAWTYVPDFSQQAFRDRTWENAGLRLTAQLVGGDVGVDGLHDLLGERGGAAPQEQGEREPEPAHALTIPAAPGARNRCATMRST
jgi:hypothetical protein